MSNPYVKDPDFEDFKAWLLKEPKLARSFYHDFILDTILELEEDDYFGTEGFDKWYA